MEGSPPLEGPRARIMRRVRQGRGVTLTEIMALTGLGLSAVRHHIARLHAANLIRIHRHGGTAYVFPSTTTEDEAERRAQWRHDPTLHFIVQRLRRGPLDRSTLDRELQERRGLGRMGSWKALERALASGWIQQDEGTLSLLLVAPP